MDWFHISMRARHVEQALTGLLGSDMQHKGPLRYAEGDIVQLRNVIWDGYGNEAHRALPGIVNMAANEIWLNGHGGQIRIERFAQLVRNWRPT